MIREWDVAGRRLVVCYVLFWRQCVIRSGILQIQLECGKKMIPFHSIWGQKKCWYNFWFPNQRMDKA